MVKIKCIGCGDTGYTASPDRIICKCGARYKVIPDKNERKEEDQCQKIKKRPLPSISS